MQVELFYQLLFFIPVFIGVEIIMIIVVIVRTWRCCYRVREYGMLQSLFLPLETQIPPICPTFSLILCQSGLVNDLELMVT